tara:strand:+ start:677 stop:997 length:321 start_codon:yes stop_codon:yes gene_type:complete
MSGNTDVLMGYFDSLLTTVDEDPRKAIVSDLLAGAAAQAPEEEYKPVAIDTIALGMRVIALKPPLKMNAVAINRITALRLLHVVQTIPPSRLKLHVLSCCAGVLDV